MRDTRSKDESSPGHTRMRAGVEFDVVRRFVALWQERSAGIGDDAALIAGHDDSTLVASIDSSVENVHFKREWLTPREIGFRAAASALSDLAAMAAQPLGLLSALVLPESWMDGVDGIAQGIGDAASVCGTKVLGGDLSGGSELCITISVLGATTHPLRRAGAKAGDLVYVTGQLGAAGTALRGLQQGRTPTAEQRERFAHPIPRIAEAIWLGQRGVSSAIDISDGLIADLQHVAAASDVAIAVEAGSIPVAEGVSPIDAAASGEEYELAVTSASELDTSDFTARFGIDLTRIGVVREGSGQVILRDHGTEVALPPGYLHFRK